MTDTIEKNEQKATTDNTALTTPEPARPPAAADDPYVRYGQSVAGDLFLKYVRGEFLAGPEGEKVPLGTRLAVCFPEFYAGYVRWWNGEPTDERLVRVCDGPPPVRHMLGDEDKDKWEVDEDTNKPRDPWQWTNRVLFRDLESGVQYIFVTSSQGGTRALGKLSSAYGQQRQARPGQLPIVELQTSSYPHKRFGKVHTPVFLIIDWIGADGLPADDPPPAADLDDEIPF